MVCINKLFSWYFNNSMFFFLHKNYLYNNIIHQEHQQSYNSQLFKINNGKNKKMSIIMSVYDTSILTVGMKIFIINQNSYKIFNN